MVNKAQTIPKGWQKKQIKDLLDYERPDKYIVESDRYIKNGIPVLTANKSFILGYTDEKEGIYKDFPVIVFDDFTTDSKYADFPFKVKSSAIKLLKNKEGVDLRFVYEKMKSITFPTGSHKRYYISQYQNMEILVPPLTEQKKIAEILRTVDEEIQITDKVISTTNELRKGFRDVLLNYGLNHNKSTKVYASKLPPGWRLMTIEDVAEVKAGNGFPIKYQGINGDTPFYKVSDMNLPGNEKFLNTANNYVNEGVVNKIKGTIFKPGCIVYPKVGAALLGNKRRILSRASLVDNNIGVLIPKTEVLNEYLYNLMLEVDMSNFSGKGALPAVNASTVKAMRVKIPPIKEQEQIIELLNSIDEKISFNEKLREKLIFLKKGLMQDLLTGKKRTI